MSKHTVKQVTDREGSAMTDEKEPRYQPPSAWIDGKPLKWYSVVHELTRVVADGLFHVGQVYENNPAETVECTRCGGRDFNVGSGNFFTAIRCVKCHWEVCFHDG